MIRTRFNPTKRQISMLALALLIVASSNVFASGQQSGRPQSASAATSGAEQPSGRGAAAVLVSPDEDYRIGPNDLIDIKVENLPELTQAWRVTAAGTFLLPYIGRVTAAKKTTEELAQLIADKLRGDYLKDPRVSVSVKEYNSRSFFIQGSVRNPGVFQIEGRPTMLELLTLAGGLTEKHGATAYILRKIKTPASKGPETVKTTAGSGQNGEGDSIETPKYEMKSANINGLLKGRFDQDVLLEAGDIINIPPTDVFFVAGEVNAPGSFALADGTTLRQAISLAQGTNYKAALSKGIIFRENNAGQREELHVDIGAVMSGKKEDILISPNDIVMVPNSRSKSIGGALLKAFGMTTITRMPL
jgi:polysaccharide export outer membrane protein